MNKFTETNQGRYVVNPTTWQLIIQLDYVFFSYRICMMWALENKIKHWVSQAS